MSHSVLGKSEGNLQLSAVAQKSGGDGKSPRNETYRFLGKVKVKGKDNAIKIFDCYDGDPKHIHQLKSKTRADFERALQFYYNRKFGKAADLFKIIDAKFKLL